MISGMSTFLRQMALLFSHVEFGTCYVDQLSLKVTETFLPQLLECWD